LNAITKFRDHHNGQFFEKFREEDEGFRRTSTPKSAFLLLIIGRRLLQADDGRGDRRKWGCYDEPIRGTEE
jgi:hypothetical protein